MLGAIMAAVSGIGFGFFQAFNRRAGQGFGIYTSTFVLLAVSAVILVIGSLFTEDLSMLSSAPFSAYLNFSLAGFIHFFLGWTLLTTSQNKVGAARTGALVGAAPVFATVIGVIAFQEYLNLWTLLGILTMVAGVYLVSVNGKNHPAPVAVPWRDSLYGLGVAICFSISPIFIRAGLEQLASPLLGVTIGMAASALAYGLLLLWRPEPKKQLVLTRDAQLFQLAAGVMVGLSTWLRWLALDMAPVAVVLALGRLNVPVVVLISPFLVQSKLEQVTLRIWVGAALVVLGSFLLIFTP